MSAVASSREQVLQRVRAAAPGTAEGAMRAWAAIPRGYVRRGSMSIDARLERMMERLREYDAETAECSPEALPEAIAAQIARSGRHRFVAPEGVPQEWLATGCEWKIDRGLPVSEIEEVEGVVAGCFCGVAESGTIALHHSPTEGRRVLTLLPDWHLCILSASQVVETLPEYFSRSGQLASTPRLVTWVSGPSATADIEMTRIKGVHGPRFLNVILVRDEDAKTDGNGSRHEIEGEVDRTRREVKR
jgi:L-lactate dehydrogenase complex protein LldG